MYSRVSNRRGGWNKPGGCQISANIINGGQISAKMINGEASKNTTIINFIEIKSSKDLAKISIKRT